MTAQTVCTCSFCKRGYTLAEFLRLPLPHTVTQRIACSIAHRHGRDLDDAGRDWSDVPGGAVCVVRDCPCRAVGERTTLAMLVNADGSLEVG
jgi:hypothetical protein